MSLSSRHMIDKVTVWTPVEGTETPSDPFNDPVTHTRIVLPCEYESGGKTQKDQSGAEFQPETTIYTVTAIAKGASVKIGEHSETSPPNDAETVRKVGGGTSLSFQVSEFVAWTG